MSTLLRHALDAELSMVAEGILEGRVVPYNSPAMVSDVGDDGKPDRYIESFRRGVFARQIDAAMREKGRLHQIRIRDQHDGDELGYAVSLREDDDGLHAGFRIRPSRLDDVAMMLADDIDALSVGFIPKRNAEGDPVDGTEHRVRVAARIDHVALVPVPAYAETKGLALRADNSTPRRDAMAARLARVLANANQSV